MSPPARAAAPENLAAHLDVEGDAACVPHERLEALVRLRSRRLRFVEASPDVPLLRVRTVTSAEKAVSIELQVTRPGGRRSVRWLRARNCEDALEATALVIAITLDASADTSPSVADTSANTDATATDATATSKANGGSQAKPNGAANASDTTRANSGERDASTDATRNHESAAQRFQFSLGLAGSAIGGPAPVALPGITAFASVASERSGFAPAIRLGLSHYFSATVEASGGRAEFGAEVLSLDLCPLGLRSGPIVLRACGEALGAVVLARGGATYFPQSHTRPYLAVGGSVLGAAALGRRISLALAFGLGANLLRDRFAFSPDVFYRVPGLTWNAAAGLEFRFP